MWAMAMKEFRQMRRDRRTLAMMILLPVLLLVVFGYAASFDVDQVKTVVVGPRAQQTADALPDRLEVVRVAPGEGREAAVEALRDADASVAVVTSDAGQPQVLVDGADLFAARSVVTELRGRPGLPAPEVLFNPGLETSAIMVPGLMGVVLVLSPPTSSTTSWRRRRTRWSRSMRSPMQGTSTTSRVRCRTSGSRSSTGTSGTPTSSATSFPRWT